MHNRSGMNALTTQWTFSDDPRDWMLAAALLLSVIYVIGTWLLLRAVNRQAQSASRIATLVYEQTQLDQLQRWTPIAIAIEDALPRIEQWLESRGSVGLDQFLANGRALEERAAELSSPVLAQSRAIASQLHPMLYGLLDAAESDCRQVTDHVARAFDVTTREARHESLSALDGARGAAQRAIRALREAREIVLPVVARLKQNAGMQTLRQT